MKKVFFKFIKKIMQLTIDCFSNNESVLNYKKYFCLEWIDRDSPIKNAYWSDKPLKNYNIKFSFINKSSHLPVIVLGNINLKDFDIKQVSKKFKIDREYSNINLLKSHLQKCIRRKKDIKAVQTAWHILEIDEIQFLRRLCIIFPEDIYMHESFSTLCWLMIVVSAEKMKLNINHKEWLLGLVHLASNCEIKDNISEDFCKINIIKDVDYNHDLIDLFLSLNVRIGYGGMKGDMNLLKNTYLKFKSRNKKTVNNFYYQKIRTISYDIRPLKIHEWELSAIDFHCFPKMMMWLLEEYYEEYSYDELKSLIWHNRSKINKREKNPKINNSNWKELKYKIDNMSRYIIKNYS